MWKEDKDRLIVNNNCKCCYNFKMIITKRLHISVCDTDMNHNMNRALGHKYHKVPLKYTHERFFVSCVSCFCLIFLIFNCKR